MENKKWDLKWMAWELTSQCNMNCVHCRSSSEITSPVGKFTLEKASKLMDDIVEFASPVIVLSGGEPLLRKDFFDIAKMGTAKGFRMAMATNGLLVNDKVCENILESGIRMVSLSLDGHTKELHDDFRGQKGAFEAVMNAAEKFNKHGIKFIINSSFTKRNQPYIMDTFRLAKKIGAHAWYMFLIVPTGRGEDIMKELVSKEDYEEILKWHYEMERNEEEILVRPTCAPQYYRVWHSQSKEEGKSTERRSLTFGTGGGKGCIAAQSICFVNSDGDVLPCSYFPLSAGNVFEQPLKEIWDSSKLFQDLRDFKSYDGKCGKCRYLGVCGGCRARSYAVTGDYMAEEPYCDYVPENYK
ncbi:MAG: radical SAM protein [Deferribacteraceae bacterium]|jgi:radical SAM protein with 4Fe4S-binding SPASM domain|nr:radical SAM protein [Deferribacteraceae bacterium]